MRARNVAFLKSLITYRGSKSPTSDFVLLRSVKSMHTDVGVRVSDCSQKCIYKLFVFVRGMHTNIYTHTSNHTQT